MQEAKDTDLTIELFNFCRGTCTGCALSASERREEEPNLSLSDFKTAIERVSEYGKHKDMTFRSVLTFGDVIWMPLNTLEKYWSTAVDHGVKLGCTMTLVDEREDHYRQAMELLKSIEETAVFDITIDPVRLQRYPDYAERIRMAIEIAPHVHTQVLLSEAVIEKFAPEDLSQLIVEQTGKPAVLGFAASLSNISHKNYRYDVKSAADYAVRYYCATPENLALMQADLHRFHWNSAGSYSDFLKQTLHIGHQLDVFPNAYTVFGDVIFDHRNNGRKIGNLKNHTLEEVLSDVRLLTMSALNAAQLDADKEFGCNECEFKPACSFNGVGMARKIYSDFEVKSGSCYGPKGLVAPHTPKKPAKRIITLSKQG
jgi:hypothetical protein